MTREEYQSKADALIAQLCNLAAEYYDVDAEDIVDNRLTAAFDAWDEDLEAEIAND